MPQQNTNGDKVRSHGCGKSHSYLITLTQGAVNLKAQDGVVLLHPL